MSILNLINSIINKRTRKLEKTKSTEMMELWKECYEKVTTVKWKYERCLTGWNRGRTKRNAQRPRTRRSTEDFFIVSQWVATAVQSTCTCTHSPLRPQGYCPILAHPKELQYSANIWQYCFTSGSDTPYSVRKRRPWKTAFTAQAQWQEDADEAERKITAGSVGLSPFSLVLAQQPPSDLRHHSTTHNNLN